MPGRPVQLAILVATALVVAGCGGSSGLRRTTTAPPDGRHVFITAGCAGCHTLKAAGARGLIGPDFDVSERLTPAQIKVQLNAGVAGMPSFRDRLSPAEQTAVAQFLASAMRARGAPTVSGRPGSSR